MYLLFLANSISSDFPLRPWPSTWGWDGGFDFVAAKFGGEYCDEICEYQNPDDKPLLSQGIEVAKLLKVSQKLAWS